MIYQMSLSCITIVYHLNPNIETIQTSIKQDIARNEKEKQLKRSPFIRYQYSYEGNVWTQGLSYWYAKNFWGNSTMLGPQYVIEGS